MVKFIVENESSLKQLAVFTKTVTKLQQNFQNKNVTEKFYTVLEL